MTAYRWDDRWCDYCDRRTRPFILGWEMQDGTALAFCSLLHWYLWPLRLAWRHWKRPGRRNDRAARQTGGAE